MSTVPIPASTGSSPPSSPLPTCHVNVVSHLSNGYTKQWMQARTGVSDRWSGRGGGKWRVGTEGKQLSETAGVGKPGACVGLLTSDLYREGAMEKEKRVGGGGRVQAQRSVCSHNDTFSLSLFLSLSLLPSLFFSLILSYSRSLHFSLSFVVLYMHPRTYPVSFYLKKRKEISWGSVCVAVEGKKRTLRASRRTQRQKKKKKKRKEKKTTTTQQHTAAHRLTLPPHVALSQEPLWAEQSSPAATHAHTHLPSVVPQAPHIHTPTLVQHKTSALLLPFAVASSLCPVPP